MRFNGARKTWWLALSALALVILAWIWPDLGQPASGRNPAWVLALGAASMVLTAIIGVWEFLVSWLLNYAELGEAELKAVSGLRRRRVPYRAITSINRKYVDLEIRRSNVRVQGVVVEADGKKLFVQVQDEHGFIDELKRRCPQAAVGNERPWVS